MCCENVVQLAARYSPPVRSQHTFVRNGWLPYALTLPYFSETGWYSGMYVFCEADFTVELGPACHAVAASSWADRTCGHSLTGSDMHWCHITQQHNAPTDIMTSNFLHGSMQR